MGGFMWMFEVIAIDGIYDFEIFLTYRGGDMPDEKKIKYSKYALCGFTAAAIICIIINLFGGIGRGTSVSGNRGRVDDTGAKLDAAIGNQQAISAGIADSQRTAQAIGDSIDRSYSAQRTAAEAIDRTGSLVGESERLAAENTELINAIRSRGLTRIRSQD